MEFVFSTQNGSPYLTFIPTNSNDRSVLGVVLGRLHGPVASERYKGETVSFDINNILANCPMTVNWDAPSPLKPESDPGKEAPDTPPPPENEPDKEPAS